MIKGYSTILAVLMVSCMSHQVFSQYARDSNYAYNQGAQYFKDYKFEEAITWFDRSIKSGRQAALSYTFKAGAEILLGRVQEGKADLDRAFAIDSSVSHTYFYRGRQLMMTNDYDAAIFFLKKAIDIDPTSYSFYDNLAKAFLAKGLIDSAKQAENQAIGLSRNGPMFINNLAVIEFEAGDYSLALLHHKRALDLSFKATGKRDPAMLIGIAACEWKLKKYQDALSGCEEILKNYPDYSGAYKLRGLINYDLGNKEKACGDFMMVSQIKGTEKEGLENLKSHGCPVGNKPK